MFESLSDRLERSFKILKGHGHISEINVAETVKDVRRALLDADVSYKIAKEFTDTVKEKALGQKILSSVSPGQLMVKIVHDELASLMGDEMTEIDLKAVAPVAVYVSAIGYTACCRTIALITIFVYCLRFVRWFEENTAGNKQVYRYKN